MFFVVLLFFLVFRETLGCCTCEWFRATPHTRLRSKPHSSVFSWKPSSKIFRIFFPYFVRITFSVTSHRVPFVCYAFVFFLYNQTGPHIAFFCFKTWLILMPNSLAFVLHIATHTCVIHGFFFILGVVFFYLAPFPSKLLFPRRWIFFALAGE